MTELIVALDAWNNEVIYEQLKNKVTWFKLSLHSLLLEEDLWQKILDDGNKLFWDFKLYDTEDTVKRLLDIIECDMVTIHSKALNKINRGYPFNIIQVNSLTDDDTFDLTTSQIADGIVCNVELGKAISHKLTVCPGIRLEGSDKNNHKKSFTPKEAKHPNIDYIVVGRPIYNSKNPVAITEQILEDLT